MNRNAFFIGENIDLCGETIENIYKLNNFIG